MAVLTNPHVSSVHAANFSREIANARDIDALKSSADRHGPYLLGADKVRLRDEYTARLLQLRGLKP